MKHRLTITLSSLLFAMASGILKGEKIVTEPNKSPRIVNIVNFIRQCEPRIDWITEEVLYETVVEQVKIMNKHQLRELL